MDILPFIQAFVLLLMIMDPLVSIAAFLTMTKGMKRKEQNKIASKAVLVAAIPLFLFVVFGNIVLDILKVDLMTFKAAGGVVLLLLGIQYALGISLPKEKEDEGEAHDGSAIAAVIGTPLITGPATISAAVILTNEFGREVTAIAGIAALIVVWVTLLIGPKIHGFLGRTGLSVLSTMMGLVTIAWGVSFLKEGLFGA